MKKILAALLLALPLINTPALAQSSLPHGVSINNLAATRQADGVWVITSAVSNHRDQPVNGLSVTYALYDAQGNKIGQVTDQRASPLAPGDTWQAQTTTTQDFVRFSAKDIRVQ